jgi:predicted  nucleic acid-binding Zn-ribbon protein
MSEQPTITYSLEKILSELQSEIKSFRNEVTTDLKAIRNDVTDLKVGQAKLEEKLDGLSKRIDNQEFVSRGILLTLLATVLGGAAKMFGIF